MPSYEYSRPILLEILMATRSEIARPSHGVHDIDSSIEIAHRIETMRILLNSIGRAKEAPLPVLDRILYEVRLLLDLPSFVQFAKRRFPLRPNMPARDQMAEVLPMERPTIRDALELFHRLIVDLQAVAQRELDLGANGYSREEASARLANIVPLQKVAPVQFLIDQDRLKVEHHYSKSHPADQNNVTAARDALLDQGSRILESLRTSNCDPRLLDALKQLHSNLHDMQDVVRLGIQNIACEELRLGFEPELPTALAALIKGHTTAIGLYVAQFPEWQQFTDNAARVELNPDDIRQLRNTAYDLVAELEEDDRVDIEVPASLKFLADAAKDPVRASKRTSFALLRSLENLIAKIFRYAADLVSEIAGETKKTVSKTVAGVVGRFVGIVLAGAIAVLPVYGKFADTAWMKSAAPLVQSLLSNSPK